MKGEEEGKGSEGMKKREGRGKVQKWVEEEGKNEKEREAESM